MARSGTATDPGGRFNSKIFRERVDQLDAKKADIGVLRGEISAVWKFVEDHGGNKAAMRAAMKIRDMPDGTRNDYLAYLQTYCEWLNVFSQQDMFGDQPGIPRAAAAPVPPAAELPLSEEEIEAEMAPVVTIEQIDAAELQGYSDAQAGRSPGFTTYESGTVERVAYDRGYTRRMAEVSGQAPQLAVVPTAEEKEKRQRGRPRTSRIARGQRLSGTGRRPPGRPPRPTTSAAE